MTTLSRRVLAALLLGLIALPATSRGQASPPAAGDAPASEHDCSRWPASVFDTASSNCVCPSGMWWNLRGDACLPREHAATEFCTTVWPGSQPYFVSGGGYRCVCAPPLLWDAQATGCRPPTTSGDEDCTKEWPGTLPVLSPSGTEFECRCPAGRRWDEATRSCVQGAPVVVAPRGFANEGAVPSPAPGMAPMASPPPTAIAPSGMDGEAPPAAAPRPATPGGVPPVHAHGDSAACDSLLSEIRGRAGAGQTAEADALGMKAAVAGCDPAAISEASRTKPAAR